MAELTYSEPVGFRLESEMNAYCARRDAQEKRLAMAELTQEQVGLALKAVEESQRFVPGEILVTAASLRVAAPFLQLPWDEPTDEELGRMVTREIHSWDFVRAFVRSRNAALLPKPVDPRKAKIVGALCGLQMTTSLERLADLVISALDEVK